MLWIERQVAKIAGIAPSETGSETALRDREALFRNARESIRIVSSTLPARDSLIEAAERGVAVEVITKQGQYFSDILRLVRKGISVFELKHDPLQEFDIVDGKHGRIEKPPVPGVSSRRQLVIRNLTNINEFLQRFSSLREEAAPYEIP